MKKFEATMVKNHVNGKEIQKVVHVQCQNESDASGIMRKNNRGFTFSDEGIQEVEKFSFESEEVSDDVSMEVIASE